MQERTTNYPSLKLDKSYTNTPDGNRQQPNQYGFVNCSGVKLALCLFFKDFTILSPLSLLKIRWSTSLLIVHMWILTWLCLYYSQWLKSSSPLPAHWHGLALYPLLALLTAEELRLSTTAISKFMSYYPHMLLLKSFLKPNVFLSETQKTLI